MKRSKLTHLMRLSVSSGCGSGGARLRPQVRPARQARAIAALLAGVCSLEAAGQATELNVLPSPLRSGSAPQAMFDGTALKLDVDGSRLERLRGKDTLQLSEFMLAPGAAGAPPRSVTLNLRAMNAFGPETHFVLGDPTGQGREIELPLPDVMIFEGTVRGEPGSEVFLAFSEHGTYGFVNLANTQQIISSGPVPAHGAAAGDVLIYDPRVLPQGTIHWRDFVCGTVTPQGVPQPASPEGANPPCRSVLLAIETDYEFTDDLFNGNLTAAANYVAVMTTAASNRLTIAINARIRLGYVRLWNSPADPWNMNGTSPQLEQFRNHWEASMEWVPRNLVHFLSGRDLGGGVAWLEVMCNPDWGYGLSANLDGFFPVPMQNNHAQNWDIYVFCHELGHNFGTIHTHEFCPPVDRCAAEEAWGDCQNSTVCINNGTFMSYCHTCSGGVSNIVLAFHGVTSQAMLGHLDAVPPEWCVLDCPPAALLVPQTYPTIQAAINAAYNGDEVVLADGTYAGLGNTNLDFRGKVITLRSASGNPAACIIDCQNNVGRAISLNDGETLATTISGLTLKRASIVAVEISNAGATFSNCVFADNLNSTAGAGAAILAGSAADLIVIDCSFINNAVTTSVGGGAAVFASGENSTTLENCLFEGNSAVFGAGAIAVGSETSTLTASGCTFRNNTANAAGAILAAGTMTLENCTFFNNRCLNNAGSGGAIYLGLDGAKVISNCAFFGNRAGTATGDGGAIYCEEGQFIATNCVFSGNRAGTASGGAGGAIAFTLTDANLANCTFAGNIAQAGAGIMALSGSARIRNSILWGNLTQQAGGAPGLMQMTYSDIQGGSVGEGNINLDPLFINPIGPDNMLGTEDDDLRIASNSPVIDMGTHVQHHVRRNAAQWLALRPGAETATFDHAYHGIVNGTGCLSGGIGPAVVTPDGGTMTVTALDSGGNPACAVIDGSTPTAVSDASLATAGAKLRLQFDPPITAFYTFYGSLDILDTGSLRLFHDDVEVGLLTSLASSHATNATGHGFSALAPIDEIEVTVTDSASVMGAFAAIWPGESSLGTTNISGYSGPQGPNVLNDFGVVFGDADLPGDLDNHPRVADGDSDGIAIVDMGAYELQRRACPADIATGGGSAGVVGIDDLLMVISAWGACPPPPAACPANIVASGGGATSVDIDDLLAVISAWGPCP